ncbi:MAG: hypothetical protein H7145_25335 [Akkermansiaceae bacterium]|nr:hypothetical protein [Armatimonadota bacterium]
MSEETVPNEEDERARNLWIALFHQFIDWEMGERDEWIGHQLQFGWYSREGETRCARRTILRRLFPEERLESYDQLVLAKEIEYGTGRYVYDHFDKDDMNWRGYCDRVNEILHEKALTVHWLHPE